MIDRTIIATGELAGALARYADDVDDVPATVAELAGEVLEATRRDWLARNAPARAALRRLRDSKPATPFADAFGPEVADQLARWALDVLCSGWIPAKGHRYASAAKVPWRDINEGRQLLEEAGIDWRKLHAQQVEYATEASVKAEAEARARKIAEQAP